MVKAKDDYGKTNYIKVRMNDLEKETLKKRAEMLKMSMSDYIRYCCLTNPPVKVKKDNQ